MGEKIINEQINSDLLNIVKLKSPTQKLNLDKNKEDKLHACGMQLLINFDDIENTMKADLDDLEDDTILFINSHHIVECISIIDGALQLLVLSDKKYINLEQKDSIINDIIDVVKSGIIRYSNLKFELENIIYKDRFSDIPVGLFNGLKYIISNVWFLPYGEIDAIAQEAINNMMDGGEKND